MRDIVRGITLGRRGLTRKRGFTLIEVIMTVAILTSVSLGSLLVMVPVARQSRLNKEVDIANAEVQRVLESIQAAPFNHVTTLYPDSTSLLATGLQNGVITIDYDDPNADPLTVMVTITWEGLDSGNYSRTFLTVRTE